MSKFNCEVEAYAYVREYGKTKITPELSIEINPSRADLTLICQRCEIVERIENLPVFSPLELSSLIDSKVTNFIRRYCPFGLKCGLEAFKVLVY